MNKCYIVYEFGGDNWDNWEVPKVVYLNKEKAEKYVEQNSKEIPESSLSVSREAFQMALEVAWSMFPEDRTTSFPELILRTGEFSEWSLEELNKTDEYLRREESDWMGLRIEEIDLCQ